MKSSLKVSIVVLLITTIYITQSCIKPTPPRIKTKAVTAISFSTAVSGGVVIDDGRASIVSKGVCWNISGDPTAEDSKTIENGSAVSFTCNIRWLSPNTTYYVRAFAKNSEGIGYGDLLSFTTLQPVTPVLTTSAVTSITQTTAVSGGT